MVECQERDEDHEVPEAGSSMVMNAGALAMILHDSTYAHGYASVNAGHGGIATIQPNH